MKAGLVIVVFFTLVAVFANQLVPYNPDVMYDSYLEPSKLHKLGTNDVGQDILSELIIGTRVSLTVGFFAAFVSTVIGTVLGISAGYFGGM